MRLLRLLPEQIMQYWPEMKRCMQEAMPAHLRNDDSTMVRIQEACLIGQMQIWAVVAEGDAEKIYGIASTTITQDPCTMTKNLLVYTVTMLEQHPWTLWEQGYEKLSQFARERGCDQIIAYTNQIEVFDIAQRLGGDTSWRLLTFKLR